MAISRYTKMKHINYAVQTRAAQYITIHMIFQQIGLLYLIDYVSESQQL